MLKLLVHIFITCSFFALTACGSSQVHDLEEDVGALAVVDCNVRDAAGCASSQQHNFDRLFQAYAACYELDWRLFKAVAKIESNLNPNAATPSSARYPAGKYQGLFMISRSYCKANMVLGSGYPASLGLSCEDLKDSETNAAVVSTTIGVRLKQIQGKCPQASLEDSLVLLYVAFNNGPGVMHHAIKKGGCSGDHIRLGVRDFYDSRGGSFRGVTTNWGEYKYRYGFKLVDAAKRLGVTELYPSGVDRSICPKYTGRRVLP